MSGWAHRTARLPPRRHAAWPAASGALPGSPALHRPHRQHAWRRRRRLGRRWAARKRTCECCAAALALCSTSAGWMEAMQHSGDSLQQAAGISRQQRRRAGGGGGGAYRPAAAALPAGSSGSSSMDTIRRTWHAEPLQQLTAVALKQPFRCGPRRTLWLTYMLPAAAALLCCRHPAARLQAPGGGHVPGRGGGPEGAEGGLPLRPPQGAGVHPHLHLARAGQSDRGSS